MNRPLPLAARGLLLVGMVLVLISCAPSIMQPTRASPLEIIPAWILDGIKVTESSGRPDAIGDDGISIGAYQINERFHAERAARWGEYDPRDPGQARRLAGLILEDNRARLYTTVRRIDPDSWEDLREALVIASYRQGVTGVHNHGPTAWYVERVRRAAR